MTEGLLLALVAGMVATVNPCGFAMLPAYLALVVQGHGGGSRVGRALAAAAVMTAGFVVVFGVFGLVIAPVAASVQRFLPFVTVLIGVALVVFGVLLVAGKTISLMVPKPTKGAPTARLGSMFGYGVAYAIASLSCTIGPFLAVVGTTLSGANLLEGVAAFLAYALGMGLVVGVLAVGATLTDNVLATRARTLLPRISRIGGVLLTVVGLYVAYYGVYELRLFFGDADPADPVVDFAGVVQGALVDAVTAVGPWPFVAVLVLLVVAGVVGVRRRAARRRAPAASDL
ncbi:cytochrome c biogenesis CcdA family protein [Saccharothrix variisporea]|uniref:Cytochrome c biogenesis protein CcdA n=1 Tax=Saccharothrix variisporea TaxID=543527 RepID=A0A495XQ22_9PSEU|nr:cytochrome c biogenesis protein CcdA [Saccharothrix variisporea]RKT75014.1 cytochrome c biogenesis protein CcdA [Saccharothrix variisporea]